MLIKQSFLVISNDIECFFEEYLNTPGKRFGIIKPLILNEPPACLKDPRCVFVLRSWFTAAVNLAMEEQVSQVDLWLICQTSACVSFGSYNCFLKSYYFPEISHPPSFAGISHNNLSYIMHCAIVCLTYSTS